MQLPTIQPPMVQNTYTVKLNLSVIIGIIYLICVFYVVNYICNLILNYIDEKYLILFYIIIIIIISLYSYRNTNHFGYNEIYTNISY